MENSFLNNISPPLFNISAVIIAQTLVMDFDNYELNAIGNWFMLLAQYLVTYSSQMQVIEQNIDKNNININSKQYKNGGSCYTNNGKSNQNQREEVDYLIKAIKIIEKRLNDLERQNDKKC